jgi:hypothetical protein
MGVMAAPRKYPDELRERAVRLVFEAREQGESHGAIARIADKLRVHREALLALGGMGLGVGVLWAGAGQAARMADGLASADVAGRIGSAFGAGDVLTNFLLSPECGC